MGENNMTETRMKVPPVKRGDEIVLACQGVGREGDGVFKKEGYTIFAKDAIPDKTYRLRITKVLPNVGFAEVV